jgi:xanthine dehydrogenase iron-sulfur cluster and FAD-binding subunit A
MTVTADSMTGDDIFYIMQEACHVAQTGTLCACDVVSTFQLIATMEKVAASQQGDPSLIQSCRTTPGFCLSLNGLTKNQRQLLRTATQKAPKR